MFVASAIPLLVEWNSCMIEDGGNMRNENLVHTPRLLVSDDWNWMGLYLKSVTWAWNVKRESRAPKQNECDVEEDDLTIITHLIRQTVNNGKWILSNCNELCVCTWGRWWVEKWKYWLNLMLDWLSSSWSPSYKVKVHSCALLDAYC